MFDYVQNRYNPNPQLVVHDTTLSGSAPSVGAGGTFVHDIPFSTIFCLPVPEDVSALRAMRKRKFWSALRRHERLLTDKFGPVTFRVLRDEASLREALPRVQALFRERWEHEYTSLPWKTDEGFAQYADAMVDLATTGEAELAVIEAGGRLMSFGYSLISGGTYHFYQHATITDPGYRQHGPGTLLLAKLLQHVITVGRCHTVDLMLGESDYKSMWAQYSRPVYLRVRGPRTISGAVRFGVGVTLQRMKVFAQFNPAVRPVAKFAMRLIP